ncbi:uncharacterized protein LOC112551919 [Alligator sinensis]|uniref:Antimicrobial-peptide n=1 Tax=Alligator sinensis TaxID=38654 RepID=A0A2H4ZLD3_ALLSI|nr:uncharacterized protein LOC112551919 [Alligator sinensis]AUG31296.1 antimicrobial-peptide [Alligator sinensis]
MKIVYLLLGVAFLVSQAQAQDVVVAQGEAEAQDIDDMDEEVQDNAMEAEYAASMGSPDVKPQEYPIVCRVLLGVCRPFRCLRNEHTIGSCSSNHACCKRH